MRSLCWRTTFFLLALLFVLPLAARRRPVVGASVHEEDLTATEWLQRHAIPFNTTETGGDHSDLRPLSPIVGDAHLVLLGEATHGSHEFFSTKARIIEYLVEEKGFTVVSLEATLADVDRIDDYVNGGAGDPATLLADVGYWTWNTDEVLELIRWVRAYNDRRGDKPAVHFLGFDAQLPRAAAKALGQYLQQVDPANAAALLHHYDCYRPYEWEGAGNYAALPDAARAQCRSELGQLHDAVAQRRDAYSAISGSATYERMLEYARTLVQAEGIQSGDSRPYYRDSCMAENIAWIAKVAHPSARVVASAHNFHVSGEVGAPMGGDLRRNYFAGRDMVSFGFAFDVGSFHAFDLHLNTQKIFTVASPADAHEAFLRSAGLPLMFVDLRAIASHAASTQLNQRLTMWEIGAGFDTDTPNYGRQSRSLPRSFDAVIWIRNVSPSQLRSF